MLHIKYTQIMYTAIGIGHRNMYCHYCACYGWNQDREVCVSNTHLSLVLTAQKVTRLPLNERDVDILGYRPFPVITQVLADSVR